MPYILLVTFFISLFVASPAHAQSDVPPAVPVNVVKTEALPLPKAVSSSNVKDSLGTIIWNSRRVKLPKRVKVGKRAVVKAPFVQNKSLNPVFPKGGAFYVAELFTTQACPFCPRADEMMKTYADLPHVIALSCHVDYFDVKEGSLSLPICSSRQDKYKNVLEGGAKYTPQMIVNGRYGAVGYSSNKISEAFKSSLEKPVIALKILPANVSQYKAYLPSIEYSNYNIWLFNYDKPHGLIVKDGANSGKNLVYYNTVSSAKFIGSWNGKPKELGFVVKLSDMSKGFALLVQDNITGAIVLAGKNEI